MFNFFNKPTLPTQDILRLYCSKDDITAGKTVLWQKIDDVPCGSMTLKDEMTIEIKKSGWYQTILRLVVKKAYAEDEYPKAKGTANLVSFLAAIQQNYHAISLYYSDINDVSNVMMVSLNDVNFFEEGDIITVATGQCNILNVQEKQNVFTIVKIN